MSHFRKSIIPLAALLLTMLSSSVYAQISGHLVVCRGASRTTLTGTPSGGTWSSGDVTRATINATTGEVTGVNTGTATISYTDPTLAVHTAVVTVNMYVMSAIGFSMGTDVRCSGGATSTCTINPTIGNNWTSSDPAIATINTGGLVTPGFTAGTVTISYRHGYGNCYVTRDMTVYPTPTVSISTPMCAGATQTAAGTPSGGTWLSTSPSVGSINSTTGVITALAGGGTGIRYTVGGCFSQPALTVTAAPAAISGATTICVGSSATFVSATSGGTWSSTDGSVATVGSSTGVVTGAGMGVTTISYIVGSGCFRTVVVTVNAAPSASVGPDEVCAGQTIVLTNATGGGSWSSSNTSRATVTTYGGTVTGIGAGTVNISYRIGAGCAAVKTVTVNGTMASITGGPNVCEGASVSLSHGMSGGTWVASNAKATIDATTGVMTGVTAGAVNITYTANPGCVKVQMMTVKSTPAAITGGLTVCPGATTALSSASGGGTWSSSNAYVSTVGSSSGVVTGVSGGTATITYTVASWGCSTTAVVTVSSAGGSISGSAVLYPGLTSTLTASGSGGTWSSSNISVAAVCSSTGVVSAVSAGTTTITYALGSCTPATIVVTVLSTPAPITGGMGLEVGDGDTLANPVSGGVWSSSNMGVATIGSLSGILTAVGAGTTTISYAIGSTYTVTIIVTVSSTIAPAACSSSWKYLPGNWALPTMTGEELSVAVDNCGTPYIAYEDTLGNLIVQKYDGGQFVPVGSGGVVGTGGNPCIQIAHDNRVFVAYYATSDGITVRQFDGTTWSAVGTPGFASVSAFKMALDTAGLPCVAFQDGAHDYKATVMRYNGSTWVTVGTPGFSSVRPFHLNLVISNGGMPYLSSTDDILYFGTPIHGTVHRFNGSSWEILGDTTFSFDNAYKTSVAVDASGTPYVTYISPTGTGSGVEPIRGDSIRFVRFNGTSWEMINSLGFELQFAADASLKIGSDDVPYLVYLTGSDTYTEGSPLLYEQNHYSVLKYDGINWVSLGYAGGNPLVPSPVFGKCSWALNDHGVPYVAYLEDHIYSQGPVVIYPEDNEWKRVQTGQTLSRTGARAPEIAFDGEGNLYTAYIGAEYNFRTVVRKYNGHSWDFIGGPAFYPGMAYEWWPAGGGSVKLALGSGNTPYVAILPSDLTGVAVTRFDGNSWVDVGAGGLSGAFFISDLDLVVESGGSPVVVRTGSDFDSSYFELNRYDGSAWIYVGSANGNYEYPSLDADGSGNVYLSVVDADHGGKVSAYKYDGSTFASLGSPLFTADTSKYAKIAVTPGGTPYVVFADGAYGYKASVMKYNGGAWVYVGTPGFTSAAVQNTSIAIDGSGNPCVAFYDGAEGYKTTVMRYDGSAWATIGAAGISPTAGSGPTDIAIGADGDVYTAYSGLGLGTLGYPPTGAVVMKYESDAEIRGAREVCQGSSFAMSVYGDGTWSSSNPSVASVNCVGVVTGMAPGTATIIFTFDTCVTTAVVTVNPAPSAGTISGASFVVVAGSISLSSTVSGGVWSSSSTSTATVGSSSGSVAGVAPGTVTITYAVAGACGLGIATHTVNVTASRPGDNSSEGEMEFSVYPNPTTGNIVVQSASAGVLGVYGIDGRELSSLNIAAGTASLTLPAVVATGVYMLRFAGADGTLKTVRLIYQP